MNILQNHEHVPGLQDQEPCLLSHLTEQVRVLSYREERIARACSLLTADIENPPSLETLVQKLGTNRNTLTKDFQTKFGMTVFAWLREQRLLMARQLLRQTDWPISEVASVVGYPDSNHFSTGYRKRFGICPSKQRKT